MIGFLNVRKPAGPSSHDLVAAARRRLGRDVKVGHCGTLDPFAEGVLVLCVGAATRLASYVQRQPKRYLATLTLGASSTTDDPTGTITPLAQPAGPAGGESAPPVPPTGEQLRSAIAGFVGEIRQRPPAHSAVHVEGRRAYKLARRGEAVEIPERTVTVHSIEVLRYDYPLVEIDVRCGGGTYIRALARDIGAALGTAAYCSRLIRTEIGVFRMDEAIPVEDIDPAKNLLPALWAIGGIPWITLSESDCASIRTGRSVHVSTGNVDSAKADGKPSVDFGTEEMQREIAILDTGGNLVAIANAESVEASIAEVSVAEVVLRPRIVLSNT